ncbi:plexin-C1 [Alosa sapidissima]|uniref:plexin-C1 n=1 Tax=Alosa sapidissima TaxID=34773 RepID=UPI001C08425E|nr:plexin-C1 [Alosa sapidissima]
MEFTLLAVVLAVCRCALCIEAHIFDGDVVNFAVGVDKLYVLTDTQLHQMRLDLSPETRKEISNATTSNKVELLVPFVYNGTVITCGSHNTGYCEVLDSYNISKTIHKEGIGIGAYPNIAVLIGHEEDTYLLLGKNIEKSSGGDADALVTLRDTKDGQFGGIFSKSDLHASPSSSIQNIPGTEIEFVDGFQHTASSHVYLLLNEKRGSKFTVKLLSLDSKYTEKDGKYTKAGTFTTLQGAILQCCEGDVVRPWKLLSSAVIPGESAILWAGVFQMNVGDTVVAIFDISRSRTAPVSGFCINKGDSCESSGEEKSNDKVLRPAAVVFRNSSITSVAALKSNFWIVLFFGTKTGLLIKVALDEALKPGCPGVLYSLDEDRTFLPKMLFDPVNHTDVYVSQGKQMIKVPVARCGVHQTLRDCWSALDPFCGWCVSQSRCRFQHDCSNSDWVSVPGTSQQRDIMSVHMIRSSTGQDITVTAAPNLNRGIRFSCAVEKCDSPGPSNCSCTFSSESFPAEGLSLRVTITVQTETLTKDVLLKNCSSIRGRPTSALCMECMSAGCVWSLSGEACTWKTASTKALETSQDVCKNITLGQNYTKPDILSMTPDEVSIHGRNRAVIKGRNLESVTKVRFQGNMDCNPKESPVLSHSRNSSSHESLTFHIPSRTVKGTVRVCLLTMDGQCHGNTKLTYDSPPICSRLNPKTTWASGGREIALEGSNMKFVEKVKHKEQPEDITLKRKIETTVYSTPAGVLDSSGSRQVSVELLVGNTSVTCREELTYHRNPQFTSFTTTRTGNDMSVTIQKTADFLNLKESEIQVQAMQGEVSYVCVIDRIEDSNDTTSVLCDIENQPGIHIDSLKITVGKFSFNLQKSRNLLYVTAISTSTTIVICAVMVVVGLYFHRKKQRMLRDQMQRRIETIECEIRNDIRQGFVDMQTERLELISSTGAIPFLDYKHFASRIFFPEGGPLATSMMKDITQLSVKEQQDQRCRALSRLIRDQLFLTSFVHTLEEQKNFLVKDKVMVASLLTLALHDDLPYLTQVMEQLLVSLMDQPSNAQPKLLLRRTESIVEKLLTNWMSICLYGFLRECVGQPLYLLVCALMEQISKGPVDSVTGKALYTLNEDWLLWQAQAFSPLKLTVLFAVGTEGEVSEPLDISALDCDTVEQVKEKILLTFHRKFGFHFTQQLRDIDIEYERDGRYEALQEVDSSSEVMGEVTMLNTLKHYKIPDGSTIKVITRKVQVPQSPTLSFKEEPDFETKYYHLIDPELADSKSSEGKKLKVKEVYLTKLLSTKVAVHSYVENLFRSIWGTANNNRPLHAVKHFFDFLDSQAESKKISDPDVLHIWKTNSLPLRFWVNILKNPQFVFDLEKTPHLDGCLSVVAQAFMDSFSLTEQQLGKHAPTNKLLYAKDIPQYKQEVKAYYNKVKDQSALNNSEFKEFLEQESKKHENEFNESVALCEIYKFISRYFNEISQTLKQNNAPSGLTEELQKVKELFDSKRKTGWE